MRVLESEVGAELFVRDGRKLALSDEGKRLLPAVEEILGKIDALRYGLKPRTQEALIRLATFEVFSTHFLGPLLGALPPESGLELYEALPGEIERLVAERHADIGLSYLPIAWNGLEYLEITTIEMAVFGKQDIFAGISLEALPFAVPLNPLASVPTKARGLDGWPDDRLPRWRKYQVAMLESALELCRRGVAVAYLPKFVARLHNQTAALSCQLDEIASARIKDGGQSVYLIKRRNDRESPLARTIASTVRKTCRK